MRNVFDETASKFSRDIDATIAAGHYPRGELFLERARSAISAGGYVLDYGCGPGRIGIMLARSGYRVLGVDTSPGMVAQARALDRRGLDIEFAAINSASEALQSDRYDGIVCSSVIEYVPDAHDLLQGFRRALHKEGVLIISFANQSSLWRRMTTHPSNPMRGEHHQVHNWPAFRKLLSECGFRTVDGPRYFESPFDWRPFGRLLGRAPFVGTLGIVVARGDAG